MHWLSSQRLLQARSNLHTSHINRPSSSAQPSTSDTLDGDTKDAAQVSKPGSEKNVEQPDSPRAEDLTERMFLCTYVEQDGEDIGSRRPPLCR
ncbi:hypothetical protein M8818_001220 [Zalaria obscura]|uniref:Uncharacterized protein n=1 Tax=Zalaria obscura TaxID=2024903 RepID=A0ACC3SL12_9PEZI